MLDVHASNLNLKTDEGNMHIMFTEAYWKQLQIFSDFLNILSHRHDTIYV